MEHILHALANYQITPWKAVGFLGAVMFASRWFVQFYATRKHKRVTMPMAFWVLSICGSVLVLAYFIFGKNDSVGIVQNLFPALVAVYNLVVHLRHPTNGGPGNVAA
ncbi:MAG: lipid-A-disaccharide synthase N-terminal domain-containing protein [Rhodanobacteraceae bacterium]